MILTGNPSPSTALYKRSQSNPKTSSPLNNTNPNGVALQFEGDHAGEGPNWKKAALLSGLMTAPFLATATANAQPPALPPQAEVGRVYTDVDASGGPIRFVNSARDLPQLTKEVKHTVIDLLKNPALSPQARTEIEGMIAKFRAKGVHEMAVVVIPDTNQRFLNTLNTDLFNQIQLGNRQKNNGVLILVNANAVRTHAPTGRMSVMPGLGLERIMIPEKSAELLKKHALPHLNEGNVDLAVKETMIAIDQFLTENVPQTPTTPTNPNNGSTVTNPQESGNYLVAAAAILGLLALLGGGIGGAIYISNQRKKFQAILDTVTKPLNQMESGYKVTRSNVFTLPTIEALLSRGTKPPVAEDLLTALNAVEEKVLDPNKPGIPAIYLDKGLGHELPAVRIRSIQKITAENPNNRDLFAPLLAQLAAESDSTVINALEKPIANLATPQDLPQFEHLMDNAQAANRQIGVVIVNKFANAETPAKFFKKLETEPDNNVAELLQVYLTRLAKPENRELFLTNLGSGNEKVRKAAIQGLGQIANKTDFPALFDHFKNDNILYLDKSYQDALNATVSKDHLPKIHEGFQSDDARMQTLALTYVSQFPSSTSSEPLFDFAEKSLKAGNSKHFDKATALLSQRVDESNRPFLLEKLSVTEPKLLLLALNNLATVVKSTDLDKLFNLMESEQTAPVLDAVEAVVAKAVDKNSRSFLLEKLGSAKANVRLVSLSGLDRFPNAADVPTLVNALEKESVTAVEEPLLKLIGKTADKSSREFLLSKVNSPKVSVRLAVLGGLERFPNASDLPTLFDSLKKEADNNVEDALHTVISKAADANSRPTFLTELSASKPKVRLAALSGLARFPNAADVPTLIAALEKESEQPVERSLQSVINKASDASSRTFLLTKIAAPKTNVRLSALANLEKFPNAADVPAFIGALEKESVATVETALQSIITKASDASSRTFLLSKIAAPKTNVRLSALAGLEKHPNAADVPAFIGALEKESVSTVETALQNIIAKASDASSRTFLLTKVAAPKVNVRLSAVAGLAKAPNASDVPTLVNALEKETVATVDESLQNLIGKAADTSNRDFLFGKLSANSAKVRQISASCLSKNATSADAGKFFNALEKETQDSISNTLVDVLNRILTKDQSELVLSKANVNQKSVRGVAVQWLEKHAQTSDLPTLFKAWDQEQDSTLKGKLDVLINRYAKGQESFKPLVKTLRSDAGANAKIRVANMLPDFGQAALSPLFEALDDANSSTPHGLVQTLENGIKSLARDEGTLPTLLTQARSRNSLVSRVAGDCVVGMVQNWSQQADYDDSQVMQKLNDLSGEYNVAISAMATQVRNGFIQKKANELENIGNNGDIHNSTNYQTLEKYSRDSEYKVRNAATTGHQRLSQRYSIWEAEEAERQRLAAIAAAAAAAELERQAEIKRQAEAEEQRQEAIRATERQQAEAARQAEAVNNIPDTTPDYGGGGGGGDLGGGGMAGGAGAEV